MSFETVVMISAVTEFVVLSAITLTLINAFSHGAVAKYVFGKKQKPEDASAAGDAAEVVYYEEWSYRRAA